MTTTASQWMARLTWQKPFTAARAPNGRTYDLKTSGTPVEGFKTHKYESVSEAVDTGSCLYAFFKSMVFATSGSSGSFPLPALELVDHVLQHDIKHLLFGNASQLRSAEHCFLRVVYLGENP